MKTIELRPIKESTEDYEEIERKIIELFKKEIYFPLLKTIGLKQKTLKNEINELEEAIRSGRILFSQGQFSGRFNSTISKELKNLGAKWDRKSNTFKIPLVDLPMSVRGTISVSEARFREKIGEIDNKLAQIVPEEVAKNLHISKQFDSTLWKVQKEFDKSVKNITVAPQLSEEGRKRVADEWQNNMRLWIKKFTEKEIIELRKSIQENVYKGNRYEDMIKVIQDSYGVTQRKAKFLARQETNLLMAQYKQTKYVEAGVNQYKWGCVKMPHQPSPKAPYIPHEVRYSHGILEGKIFSWNDPPITTAPGEPVRRNNPGQDYNCLPGSALVSFDSSVNKAFRRWFSGEITELVTDNNIIINTTGNHPILTDRGWIAAKDVQIGDNVFTSENESLFAKEMHSKDVKSSAEQIFDALSFCLEITSDTLTESDFHNDVGEYKKVDIINVNRELVFDSIIEAHKELSYFIFERSNLSILELSPVNIFLKNLVSRNVSSSYLSLLGQIELILFTHFAHAKDISLRTISNDNSCLNQPFSNRTTSNSIFIGNCKLTHPVLIIINSFLIESQFVVRNSISSNNVDTNSSQFDTQDIRMQADNLSDFIKSENPSFIKSLRINNKRVKSFSGHVYNFETSTNWYLTEKIIIHNCRCFAIPIVKFTSS